MKFPEQTYHRQNAAKYGTTTYSPHSPHTFAKHGCYITAVANFFKQSPDEFAKRCLLGSDGGLKSCSGVKIGRENDSSKFSQRIIDA